MGDDEVDDEFDDESNCIKKRVKRFVLTQKDYNLYNWHDTSMSQASSSLENCRIFGTPNNPIYMGFRPSPPLPFPNSLPYQCFLRGASTDFFKKLKNQ